jgi:hypothetical protein
MESVPQICHESISEICDLSFQAAQSADLSPGKDSSVSREETLSASVFCKNREEPPQPVCAFLAF